jgi:uncharacterized protein (DUF433 family)
MQLEDYFDFVSPEEIKIKGHRIWIEHILYEYIHNATAPQELAERFPTLNLEKIYAALLYYHRNQEEMDRYLAEWIEHGERMWREQQQNPTPGMLRLRRLRAEREAQAQQAIRQEVA